MIRMAGLILFPPYALSEKELLLMSKYDYTSDQATFRPTPMNMINWIQLEGLLSAK